MTDPTPHDPLQAPAPAQGANDDAALRVQDLQPQPAMHHQVDRGDRFLGTKHRLARLESHDFCSVCKLADRFVAEACAAGMKFQVLGFFISRRHECSTFSAIGAVALASE